MKEEIKLAAQKRVKRGSSAVSRMRRAGYVPGIMYGTDQPMNVQFEAHQFKQLLRRHASENFMLDLDIEGDRVHRVLIREVQHHALSGDTLHVDFYELSLTERVRVAIPVELVGEPVGVTQTGGVLDHSLREIDVECLPGDIVESFELDVSGLEIGEGLLVGDIPIDKAKYEVITAEDVAVAAVAAARVEEEPEPEEEEEGAEPEVLSEKKDEDEEEEKKE